MRDGVNMDAATETRIADVRAALGELGAAQQQALMLLHEIERSLQKGDTARAVADEAILRDEIAHIGKALLEFSQESIFKPSDEAS